MSQFKKIHQKCYFDDSQSKKCMPIKCDDYFPKESWEWIVYGVNYCPFCQQTKDLLDQKKIKYYYFDVTKAPFHGKEQFKKELSSYLHGHHTFPAIFKKENLIGGYNDLVKYFQN